MIVFIRNIRIDMMLSRELDSAHYAVYKTGESILSLTPPIGFTAGLGSGS